MKKVWALVLAVMTVCLMAGCSGRPKAGDELCAEDFWVYRDGRVAVKLEEVERLAYYFQEGDETARGVYIGQDGKEALERCRGMVSEKEYEMRLNSLEEDDITVIRGVRPIKGIVEQLLFITIANGSVSKITMRNAMIDYMYCAVACANSYDFWHSKAVNAAYHMVVTEEETELAKRICAEPNLNEYEVMAILGDEEWEIVYGMGEEYVEILERLGDKRDE
jgi:hypothetical protein